MHSARRSILALATAAALAVPGLAQAQFVPPSSGTPPPPPPTTSTPAPAPAPSTATTPPGSTEMHRHHHHHATEHGKDNRPTGFSVGIGAGWTFPAQVLSPGTVSVRIRFNKSLALEPTLSLSFGNGSTENVVPGSDTIDRLADYHLGLGVNLRYAMMQAGNLDLVGIGGVLFDNQGHQVDPNGPNNITQEIDTTIGLGYGVGIEWYFARHLSFSADAMNPILSYGVKAQSQPSQKMSTTTTTFSLGLIWSPTVRLLFHVYF